MTNITLDAEIVAPLVAHALNAIGPDKDGCCPECCASCGALRDLGAQGLLDEAVRPFAQSGNWAWWVDERVDPRWLTESWTLTGCHD